LKIRIFYEETNFRFPGWRRAVILIKRIIVSEGKIPGEVNFIITNDRFLKELNVKFLNHRYNTDVIAFDTSNGNVLNGEIYISKDTVKLNANNYKVSLKEEILRVMIHGVLHLTGYNDKLKVERDNMHELENKWLKEFSKMA
jgi:rRNA maturation RNase YbeY